MSCEEHHLRVTRATEIVKALITLSLNGEWDQAQRVIQTCLDREMVIEVLMGIACAHFQTPEVWTEYLLEVEISRLGLEET